MSLRLAVVAVVLLALPSCDGGSRTTEPEGTYILLSGQLSNADGAASIKGWRAFLDGEAMEIPATVDPPASAVYLAGVAFQRSLRGHHTLSVNVLDQTASPSRYRVFAVRLDLVRPQFFGGSPGGVLDSVSLPEQTALLATGEAIVLVFDH